jgi:hypothetical protein
MISPATIYQHYVRVARRLFRALDANPSTRETEKAPCALDWPFDDMDVTTKALDELPVSPNSLLPEY